MKRLFPRSLIRSATFAVAVTTAGVAARAQVTPAVHATAGGLAGTAGGAAFGSAGGAINDDFAGARGSSRLGAGGVLGGDMGASGVGLSLQAQADALPAEAAVHASASAALDARATVRAIHQFSADSRKQLVSTIDERLDASAVAIARLHRQARTFEDRAKADFKAAAKTVEVREDQLRKSMKAASTVSADNWADARAGVAADYAAYAEAVARAEAVAHANRAMPVPDPKATGDGLSATATESTPKAAPQAQVGAAAQTTTTASTTPSRPQKP